MCTEVKQELMVQLMNCQHEPKLLVEIFSVFKLVFFFYFHS